MKFLGNVEAHQELDSQPLYNIKAVVEATGLPAATLRAWERRYGALSPGRTESGYRLYSARDIAVLRWLKARLDEGINISQAINLLTRQRPAESVPATPGPRSSEPWHGPREVREALLTALMRYDEGQADRLLEEAFAVYGLELVTENVVAPIMGQIGDMWHEGRASTATEHFASNYLRRKLDSIINAVPQTSSGPLVVLGCAPGDWHEMGLLLIHLMLRRRNINTIYLGQNVPVDQFVEEMTRLRPAMIIMAATTAESASGLVEMSQAIQAMPLPHPMFAFGGRIFRLQPELRAQVAGIFLGESVRAAVRYAVSLVSPSTVTETGAISYIPNDQSENP